MSIPQQPEQTLAEVFGHAGFLPGQKQVIDAILAGRSALAIFPTGGGKSLCYQLPALLLDGLTVVISPLIALMKDQIDFLVGKGVVAARLDSSLTREENFQVFDDLHAGRTRILYVSPERLGNERFLQMLTRIKIALLAVDEAHCISQWGHNFRPDYLRIASLARQLKVPRVLALTATATPEVSDDIAEAFAIEAAEVVQTGFYRPNLNLHAAPCADDNRREILLSRLKERPVEPAIVYVTLQKTAEQVAAYLANSGINARAYHAGLGTEKRTEIQETFMAADDMVVVATIAFGMGIDKANIRAVYHYNLPKGLESYMQEIGRAGRDGGQAHCELLACADDITTLENFSYGDTPTPEAIASLVGEVLDDAARSDGNSLELSVRDLSIRHDVRDLVVKTLLTYLELEGVLQPTGAIYTQYKFQPQRPSEEILKRFDPARAQFVADIFKQSRRGRTWFSIDVARASLVLAQPRARVIAALDYLDQKGDLILQAAGVRHGFRLLKKPDDGRPGEGPANARQLLVETLIGRFGEREVQDIARIQSVVDLVESPNCLTQTLLRYFGEERGACGHCDRCDGVTGQPLPRSHMAVTTADRQAIGRVASEKKPALGSPRQLTRFLCGIGSPASSKAKLRSHPEFGRLRQVPFAEVLAAAEEAMAVR